MSTAIDCVQLIKDRTTDEEPQLAIVLGSGLGKLVEQVEDAVVIAFHELPGFPVSGVSGHSGQLVLGTLAGTRVALLAGRAHYYEQGDAAVMQVPIEVLSKLGCGSVILSNSAGSTRDNLPPGAMMAIRDHISWSGINPLIGMQGDDRFVDLTNAYDAALIERVITAGRENGVHVDTGVYGWFSGPSFETPAEIRAIKLLGADAIGMSTVPETILARYYGLRVAAVSVITNYAAGISKDPLSHDQTKIVAAKASDKFVNLLSHIARSFSSAI
jgi:purine-nucleoside phosphorylase